MIEYLYAEEDGSEFRLLIRDGVATVLERDSSVGAWLCTGKYGLRATT